MMWKPVVFGLCVCLLGFGLTGCLIQPDAAGLPCEKDSDCAGLKCQSGYCGGQKIREGSREPLDDGASTSEQSSTDGPEGCISDQTKECYSGPNNTSGVGLCKKGKMTCVDGKWSTCVGEVTPKKEICDEKDNDCDGKVDNGFANLGQGCEAGQGECSRSGKFVCKNDGSGTLCGVQAGKPANEICDEKDNDCDGKIDNIADKDKDCSEPTRTGACRAGKWVCENKKKICKQTVGESPEACDGKDNNCDGTIDNIKDLGQDCTDSNRKGICQAGKWACENNKKVCKPSTQAGTEICDGKDNDCNGQVDDIARKDCDFSGKQGECKKGQTKCDTQGKQICEQVNQPVAETCDGKDNDCDGSVDEDKNDAKKPLTQFVYAGTTGCTKQSDGSYNCKGTCAAGVETCQVGKWVNTKKSVVPASAETCNGKDDDCNGQVDDKLIDCVVTVAGIGTPLSEVQTGFSGIAYDAKNQLLYISERDNHRIRRVDLNKKVVTILAGSGVQGVKDGMGLQAQFFRPSGLALDDKGNLYVADYGNHLIRKIELSSGTVTTIAGTVISNKGVSGYRNGVGNAARFSLPMSLAWSKQGAKEFLYIADSNNHNIRMMDLGSGAVSLLAGSATNIAAWKDADGGQAQFNTPRGLLLDGKGALYVADSKNHRIRKIILTSPYKVTTVAGSGTPKLFSTPIAALQASLNTPVGLAWADAQKDKMYITALSNRVRSLSLSLKQINTFQTSPVILNTPSEIVSFTDKQNQLAWYFVEYTGKRVRKLDASNKITTLVGDGGLGYVDGDATQTAVLNYPSSMAWDGNNSIYFTDQNVHAVRRLELSKNAVTTVVGTAQKSGSGLSPNATVKAASVSFGVIMGGLSWAGSNTLYLADSKNQDILKIDLTKSEVSWIAGQGTGYKDGPAKDALFRDPTGLVWDASNQILYIADALNHRIRKWDLKNNTVSTVAGDTQGFADGVGKQAKFDFPSWLALDGKGNLYVADSNNRRVRKIVLSTQKVETVTGTGKNESKDGPAKQADFQRPGSMTFDASNNILYIVDNNASVRMLDLTKNQVSTLFCRLTNKSFGLTKTCTASGYRDGVLKDTQFQHIEQVLWVGKSLYISEKNHRIRRIQRVP